MSTNEQVPSSAFDRVKWILAITSLIGAVYANHALVDGSIFIRVASIIGLVIAGLGIAAITLKGQEGLLFAKQSMVEARKVVWPTRAETVQTSMIILVAVTIVSLLLWGIDAILVNIVGFLTVYGG